MIIFCGFSSVESMSVPGELGISLRLSELAGCIKLYHLPCNLLVASKLQRQINIQSHQLCRHVSKPSRRVTKTTVNCYLGIVGAGAAKPTFCPVISC